MKRVTISDVAAKAGVSKATLSRYLNGQFDRMSAKTKKHISEVIEELDYRPNLQARGLKSNKSYLIGLVVADILNLYSSFLIRAIQLALEDTDYQLLIMNADNSQEEEENGIKKLLDQNVDGLFLQPSTSEIENYQAVLNANMPTVLIDRLLNKDKWPTVQSNNREVTKELIEHVAQLGYEKIIHVTSPLAGVSPRIERYEAVKEIAEEYDMEFQLMEIIQNNTALLEYLEKDSSTLKTAIFAANGNILYEVIKATTKLNLSIPKDYGICGYDDWRWGEGIAPGITVIEQDVREIGSHLTHLLLESIQGKSTNTKVEVPAKIIYRHSL